MESTNISREWIARQLKKSNINFPQRLKTVTKSKISISMTHRIIVRYETLSNIWLASVFNYTEENKEIKEMIS